LPRALDIWLAVGIHAIYYREAIADLIHGYVNPGGAMG
jgi:hypothetical protein